MCLTTLSCNLAPSRALLSGTRQVAVRLPESFGGRSRLAPSAPADEVAGRALARPSFGLTSIARHLPYSIVGVRRSTCIRRLGALDPGIA